MSIPYKQKKDLKRGKLTIPGGWKLKIPEVRLVEEDENAYIQYWRKEGYGSKEAKDKVRRDTQRIYNTRYMMLIREWIGRKAEKYQQMFPRLKLKGFRPDVLSMFFVPGRPKRTGSGPMDAEPAVTEALLKMGRMEEDEQRRDEEDQG